MIISKAIVISIVTLWIIFKMVAWCDKDVQETFFENKGNEALGEISFQGEGGAKE